MIETIIKSSEYEIVQPPADPERVTDELFEEALAAIEALPTDIKELLPHRADWKVNGETDGTEQKKEMGFQSLN